ncbi:hypothetical protein [Streptomyces sp. NBC_00057]|uniref:hypothetical protein n=1 Tax=Streptomyces sp. NBC_00057 TaxID=2975634 RepID=UPI00324B34E3
MTIGRSLREDGLGAVVVPAGDANDVRRRGQGEHDERGGDTTVQTALDIDEPTDPRGHHWIDHHRGAETDAHRQSEQQKPYAQGEFRAQGSE